MLTPNTKQTRPKTPHERSEFDRGYKAALADMDEPKIPKKQQQQKQGFWGKVKSGLASAREQKQKVVKEINWVQDFVGDSGTQMTDNLMGSPKRAKTKKEQPRTDRYMPIRKKPPPRQNLPNGSAFLRSL